jgi:hypothetical protein
MCIFIVIELLQVSRDTGKLKCRNLCQLRVRTKIKRNFFAEFLNVCYLNYLKTHY